MTTILLITFDKNLTFDKELTVVQEEGDAELGLVRGILNRHKLIIGVGVDLRQQLINNIRAVLKLASADLQLPQDNVSSFVNLVQRLLEALKI